MVTYNASVILNGSHGGMTKKKTYVIVTMVESDEDIEVVSAKPIYSYMQDLVTVTIVILI